MTDRPSHVWSQATIDDIRTKAELGRYVLGAFSTTRRVPSFDDLTFIPCTLSRVPLEGYRERCATTTVLGARCERPLDACWQTDSNSRTCSVEYEVRLCE